jgi:hypothetical protein
LNWSADRVLAWAGHSTDSPLYVQLCEVLADDPELLQLLDRIPHQPAPNILFAAVQLLLKRDPTDQLAGFYPNLSDPPLPIEDVGPVFRRFVLRHHDEILAIGAVRYTQTNECRRCTALLPAIWHGGPERFHLVDVGASAGLNLALDRYAYRWGEVTWGEAPLVLQAESRGVAPVPRPLEVLSRTALDLNPIDPADSDGAAWLEALVWPELADRLERLRAAMRLINGIPVSRVAGDALDTLPRVLAALPAGEPAVVMNSYTLNQFSADGRNALEEIVDDARRGRTVHRVSLELGPERPDAAMLMVDSGDGWVTVGEAHHHGAWLRLYALP